MISRIPDKSFHFFYVLCLALSLLFISCSGGGGGTDGAPEVSAPTITSFNPISGPVGTLVTITGTNLTGATSVSFHGTTATSFTVVNATQITATVPSGATSGTIAVTTPGGTATSSASFTVNSSTQIIADHTVVDKFDDIPEFWINEVKKMWINIPGESHSYAYRKGMDLLMAAYPTKFIVNVSEDATPEAPTDQHLRVNQSVRELEGWWGTGSGEAHWYTWYAYPDADRPAVKDRIKNHILYSYNNSLNLTAIGFGWCWDTTWHNGPGGEIDSVYNVHWAGSSEGGPDGDLRWGLDDGDIALTGNRVTMNTYLSATEEYRLYAIGIGAATKVLFTTGPVDSYTEESGYQRHLKHEYIRSYVAANSDRILFDYADILCYNDSGEQSTSTWDGHTYPVIHLDNLGDTSIGHIGSAGAIRLAKAQWWLLARIAGWDGNP